MLEIVVILKALTEVAGVGMLGQGLLYVLAGKHREQNLVYRLFKIITSPVMAATRFITPRIVLDRHIWLVAVLLLVMLWIVLTVMKVKLVLEGTAAA
jgi:hypothetical protein